jgi:hypothetical protein
LENLSIKAKEQLLSMEQSTTQDQAHPAFYKKQLRKIKSGKSLPFLLPTWITWCNLISFKNPTLKKLKPFMHFVKSAGAILIISI